MKEPGDELTREDIKREFQIERMILFSDAVFAIVITLMAIEIRLPESEHSISEQELASVLFHLLPVLLSYMVSFIFIGSVWYQHLKIFSLLKSYDRGLVVRNLFLLFFIGLFPFIASLLTRVKGPVTVLLYFAIIALCILAQYLLYHYIVIKRPDLCFDTDKEEHIAEVRKRRIALIAFTVAIIPIAVTYLLIDNPNLKGLSTMWMLLFPFVYKRMTKKK